MRTRVVSAERRMVRKFTPSPATNSKKVRKVQVMNFLRRRGLHALLMQARADGERDLVADRLEHFFFGLEVVVERAGSKGVAR